MERASAVSNRRKEAAIDSRALSPHRPRRLRLAPAVRLLSLALLAGPAAASGLDPAVAPLAAGRPVERILAPGERHADPLELPAGRYLRVTVKSTADLVVTLADPAGREIARAGPTSRTGEMVLSAVTATGGAHRLEIAAPAGAGATPYRIVVDELRPAVPADSSRVAAQRMLGAAVAGPPGEGTAAQLEEVAALYRAIGDRRGEVAALNALVEERYRLRDLPAVRRLSEQAAELARQAGDAWGEGMARNNLAVALRSDDVPAALAAYQAALACWEVAGDVAEQASTLYNVGWLYLDTFRDFDRAAEAFERSVALHRDGGSPNDAGWPLNGLGLIAGARGRYDEALRYFDLALGESRRGGIRGLEISILRNQAVVYRSRGELQEALERFLAAVATGQGRIQTQASLLHDLASLYVELGDLDQALATYRRALDLVPPEQSRASLYALINLGLVHQLQGDVGAAVAQYERALALSRQTRDPGAEALALHNLGKARIAQGRPQEALAFLEDALARRETRKELPEMAKTLAELGSAHQALGQPAQAAVALGRAVALARRLESPSLTAECLFRQAQLARSTGGGALEAARAPLEEALGLLDSVRRRVEGDDLRTSFFATKHQYYETYIDLLMQLAETAPERGYREAALAASERARARGLLDLLAEGRVDLRQGIDPDLARREAELDQDLARTQERLEREKASEAPDGGRVEALHGELLAIERRRQALQGEIRERNPRYAQVRYPESLGAAAVRELLDDRTALLEYALGTDRSYLFVLTREGLTSYRLPPRAELEQAVGALLEAVRRPGRVQLGKYIPLGVSLYQALVAPAGALLAAKPNLLIVPDGVLHLLPFELLLTRAAGSLPAGRLPYVLRDHAVAYVPSASVLAQVRALRRSGTAGHSRRLLAFGDPWYRPAAAPVAAEARGTTRSTAGPVLPRLPESAHEVSAIARLYPPSEVALYLDREATEENVKANPLVEGAERLHFATHGLLNENLPQLSGLALAQTGGAEDGVLRMAEIFNLKLTADLVVLSACETGLGKQVSGEGLVGLARAFFYAGARSLVVSLWQVPEVSTPDLMTELYRRLDHEGSAQALRRAKLRLIEGERFAHPFYWAPFVLLGDPGGIEQPL
jgi:CHAT domain-containing protein/Tfp pilus assembly protein PilF